MDKSLELELSSVQMASTALTRRPAARSSQSSSKKRSSELAQSDDDATNRKRHKKLLEDLGAELEGQRAKITTLECSDQAHNRTISTQKQQIAKLKEDVRRLRTQKDQAEEKNNELAQKLDNSQNDVQTYNVALEAVFKLLPKTSQNESCERIVERSRKRLGQRTIQTVENRNPARRMITAAPHSDTHEQSTRSMSSDWSGSSVKEEALDSDSQTD